MRPFIALHLGAGYHSPKKLERYKELSLNCLEEGSRILDSPNGSILDALVHCISILEKSGIVNAGSGSNKTSEEAIETEASIMLQDSCPTISCVSGQANNFSPILQAEQFFKMHCSDQKPSLIHFGSDRKKGPLNPVQQIDEDLFDTIGVMCVDSNGRMGVACSSGGPNGKAPGRIGPSALPGIGFWIAESKAVSYCALCSGVGEEIVAKGGARTITNYLNYEQDFICLEEFTSNLYKDARNSKYFEFGFLALELGDEKMELFASHSTPSFIFAWKISSQSVNFEYSILKNMMKGGDSISMPVDQHTEALERHKKLIKEHREKENKLRDLRFGIKDFERKFLKSEDDIKALQSVGQIIGEVLKQIDDDKFIIKSSNGPRYIVGCRSRLNKKKLVQGTRITLDMTTLTIMRILPREVDPLVYNMSTEDPGDVSFEEVGGLADQIRELREVIELPILNPELFKRIGVKAPKGVLLYGPPGTGKTLLARAVAASLDINFLKVVSSAIVDKYIGESARIIREMFAYAKDHSPCIIFMDEIDAIGGRRFSEGNSSDREVQRTLMELLNQMDGFDELGQVKIIMATNRPDTLDPALLRPGRLDRKIEISLPNENGRADILRIHSSKISKQGEINFEPIVKLSEGFNGADLRNVITEAGMFAIRDERDNIIQEDLLKAVRKVADSKKLESKLDYEKI